MASALQSNGVDAIVKLTSPESDSLSDDGKEAETFTPSLNLIVICLIYLL